MKSFIVLFVSFLFLTACSEKLTPEQVEYLSQIEKQRNETNEYMRNNPNSPFNYKGKVEFHNLNYFNVNHDMVFQSKLYENDIKDTVTIYGTKGEPRKTIKFGYVKFYFNEVEYKLHVYKSNSSSGEEYYSIWFTDKTTNDESYGVGRYLNFNKIDDINNIYTIDFNMAFNPYCAYSKEYSCAIPTKEDYIDLAINAGEKKFHD